MAKKILPYQQEYQEARERLMDSRLRLFCSLTIILYIGVSTLAYLMAPAAFKRDEFFIWAFLITLASVSLFLSSMTRTLLQAKLNTLGFSVSLVAAVMALFFIYPGYIAQSSEIFALTTFLISFVMPWSALEVILIGAIHVAGYTIVYVREAMILPDAGALIFSEGGYIDGLIFLGAAIIICTIIRKRDGDRDRETFTLMKELEKRNAQMRRELALARDIQKTLVPASTSTGQADIAVSYIPLSAVGGDYATIHATKEGGIFFLIGDVTGHGVPAALLVNRIYGEVESLVTKNPDPGKLMRQLNDFVERHFKQTHMYFTVCSGLIDFRANTLFYSNYGHPPQILLQRRDNTIRLLESQTYFLGVEAGGPGAAIFEGKVAFGRQDRIVLFTDGLIETKGPGEELYGMDRLERFVKEHAGDEPNLFNAKLLDEIQAFRDGPVTDDMFLVTIGIK